MNFADKNNKAPAVQDIRANSLQSEYIDKLPLATAIIEADGCIVAANGLFLTQAAPVSENILQSSIALLFTEKDRSSFFEALNCVMQDGAARTVAADLISWPNVTHGPHLVTIGLHTRPASQPQQLIVQIAIADAVHSRYEQLTSLEERWRYALTASKLGVWDHNLKTGFFDFSDLWLNIRGFQSADELIHNNSEWIQQVHPDDREATLHAIERQNRGDPAFSVFRYRIQHKLGDWKWIECRGMCVEWDEEGNPVRSTGTDADVTSRKDWEDNMTAMSQRLQLALEISRIGVFVNNVTTGESSWDDRMCSIYGVAPGSQIGGNGSWKEMIHPDDRERVLTHMAENLANMMPHVDEFRIIRDNGSTAYIRSRSLPFIDRITGHCMLIGADWDVSEDVELQTQLGQARDLAQARNVELEAARARIEHNALHDHLTGLPNRRYLDQVLDRAKESVNLSILHIDLDRFKQINDTQGHNVGDSTLQGASAVLRACARPDDFIARIGGDEFVFVITSGCQSDTLAELAQRIIDELRKPMIINGHACRIGASIGIASRVCTEQTAHEVLQNSDIALYRAKNLGRNRFEIFSSGMQHEIVNIKKVSDEILRGLELNEFVPYYQLQFDATTLDVCGAETLARWRHPEHGILSPDRFLAVAEDLDAVSAIDATILDQALADHRTWLGQGIAIPKVSVNVSARRLHDPALHQSVRSLGIKPGTVSFELLETVFLDSFDAVVSENLNGLRALGIDIEIDDFGSGHASIVGLVKLSPSTLKIDRELIIPLVGSPEQQKLVGSIIEIGRTLNIRVVAEGVETAEHIRILQELGCDGLQGYALARPLPASAIADFIRSASWRKTCKD